MTMREEILRIDNVTQEINGITYLDNINVNIFKGEILGLIPLDNHGMNQLIGLILQNVSITFGRVYFDEQLVNYYEHSNMTNNRVALLDKNTNLVQDLKVMDNIFVLNHNYNAFIVNKRELRRKTDELLKQLDLQIEADQFVSELTVYEKTVVELIRAVINGAQLIILNELSDFLSTEELAHFHCLLRFYIRQGISFLYITNHHEEAFMICNRLALFDRGKIIRIIGEKDFSSRTLAPYIISLDHHQASYDQIKQPGVFKCQNLYTENLKGISFSARKGQCITILGMNNSEIKDIERILLGRLKPISGEFLLDGRELDLSSQSGMLLDEVAYIPENPVQETLFYDATYLENLTFLIDRRLNKSIISKKIIENIREEFRPLVGEAIDAKELWGLDMTSLYNLAYLRILIFRPKVVFIMQPFSQADMYLRNRITELIHMLKQKEIAVVILAVGSYDILTVADKLYTIKNGRLLTFNNCPPFSE